MPVRFPFCAVAGADDMALALTLTAISPDVGGVLVRGEKGTAKSTMVRALAAVLPPIEVVAGDRFSSDPRDPHALSPDGPFGPDAETEQRPVRLVELPVGATDDRVLGSLHLQTALAEGRAEFEPGLLARAHRGILYVDEVNLLHDHLVDLLLDAAAMGRATVERDGVSVEYAARFVLVGTMNPEEGELRPQLLDRFGLTVDVAAPRDPELRAEIVRRRLAFDADPEGFAARYADDERELTERIAAAQKLLPEVELTDAALTRIAEICAAFDVDGMRADIVTAKTAAAHAAWQGRTAIDREDIAVAARLALPHRRRRNPFDAPGIDQDQLEDLLGDDEPDEPDGPDDDGGSDPGPGGGGGGTPDDGDDGQPDDGAEAPAPPRTPTGNDGEPDASAPTSQVRAGDAQRARTFRVAGVGRGQAGRRSRAITDTGRRISATVATDGGVVDLAATVRAAIPHQSSRGRTDGRLRLSPDDLRVAVKEGRESNLVLLCVDASGSMAARKRMTQVKTAVVSLLLDAYQRRDKVSLVTFRGDSGELVLPPTGSVDVAKARLDDVPAGGRTPLAEGLLQAAEVIRREKLRDPRRRPLLVVVTDGRATHGTDAVARSRRAAAHLAEAGVHALVVDCETGRFSMGLARELAASLRADYVPLGDVTADGLTAAISAHLPERAA
ncbi:VWA domain-containing protein [Aeromicrobium phragmitis]|uniref:Mg-protoporphyrin IX chelatase n=1 Tax=Aeromicrobium phragmitis TaxID=2478914 RepID=A0A3L8PLG3_9ACTN|nr:VWA domain-containing protein [Aeromicrobium phragmitis]RLV56217.1 VWA domain-containing protein [Aeromicrobium phragmitis]